MGRTQTWNLPYPDLGDPPCTLPAQLAALGDRLQQVYAQFDADLAPALAPPAAMVSYQAATPQTIDASNRIVQFTTVDTDPGGLVDLARRVDRINLPRPGLWAIGAWLTGSTGRVSNNTFLTLTLGIGGTGASAQTFSDGDHDGNPTDGETFTVGGMAIVTSPDAYLDLRLGSTTTIAFTAATMWACWITDL